MRIGVLALQGAFLEHMTILNQLSIETIKVRSVEDLKALDGLILPGGESTAMEKLLEKNQLKEPLIKGIKGGLPVWGTCAGMILLSSNHKHLNLMKIEVIRNAYGNQSASFKTIATVKGIENPLPLSFIRAPYVESYSPSVEVLCKVEGKVVAVRENHMLATAFHPEVTKDISMHKYFIQMVKESHTV